MEAVERHRRRISPRSRVAIAVIVLLVVAIAAVVSAAGSASHSSGARLPSSVRAATAGFGVFTRPQTAADRAGNRGAALPFPTLTRLVARLHNGQKIFLVVARNIPLAGIPQPAYAIWQLISDRHGGGLLLTAPTCCTYPTSERTGQGRATFAALVPNGVARVEWSWAQTHRRHRMTVSIATPSNFAATVVPTVYGDWPELTTGYSANGARIFTHHQGP
jgi:hypothetical protein